MNEFSEIARNKINKQNVSFSTKNKKYFEKEMMKTISFIITIKTKYIAMNLYK
jgi:hypothetical protein